MIIGVFPGNEIHLSRTLSWRIQLEYLNIKDFLYRTVRDQSNLNIGATMLKGSRGPMQGCRPAHFLVELDR